MIKDVIVLGAGISGLSLSWFLKKRYGSRLNVKIIEKSPRVGGWIHTLKQDGFLFEQGPRSCRTHGQGLETLKLIEDLQLENEIIPSDSSSKFRYIYKNGRLTPLPNGFLSLLTSPYLKPLIQAFWRDWFAAKGDGLDESVADFINRRLGSQIAEELIDPMLSGIYAGNIRELSIRSCFPDLFAWEQAYGGITRGLLYRKKQPKTTRTPLIEKMLKYPIFTLKNGMETLPIELAKRLDAEILLDSDTCTLLQQSGKAKICLADGRSFLADHVFSTLPPAALGQLLQTSSIQCASILQTIPAASLAVVNLGYNAKILKIPGFGYLIPSRAKEKILGIVWDSFIFPQQQQPHTTCMTVMLGGIHNPQIGSLTKTELLDISLKSIEKHLGVTTKPDSIQIKISLNSIPQPLVGHEEKIKKLQTLLSQQLPCLTTLGSYYGVSVNACIANAKKIADNCKLTG